MEGVGRGGGRVERERREEELKGRGGGRVEERETDMIAHNMT